MGSLPLGAMRYFRSKVFQAVPRGQQREHALRFDVWSRIRVLGGALAVMDGRSRRVARAGELLDVEPGVPHHLEPLGQDVSFVVHLYRVWPELLRNDLARWENEGGKAQS